MKVGVIGGGGAVPYPGPPPAAPISGYFLFFWTVYLGSIVKFYAFYEYCGVISILPMSV